MSKIGGANIRFDELLTVMSFELEILFKLDIVSDFKPNTLGIFKIVLKRLGKTFEGKSSELTEIVGANIRYDKLLTVMRFGLEIIFKLEQYNKVCQ